MAEANDQALQPIKIDRWPATDARQRAKYSRALDQAAGQGAVERRQGERAVLVDLDQQAAAAEQQNRTKLLIDRAAQHKLKAAADVEHRLDLDPLERVRWRIFLDLPECAADFRLFL